MYSVSLLPSEYRMLITSARRKGRMLLIAILIMILLASVYLVLTAKMVQKDGELEKMQLQNALLDKKIAELTDLENMNIEANSKLRKVISAYGTHPDWESLIAELGNSVPDSIGLTYLGMTYANGSGQCSVQGTARDNQSISEWMKELKAIPGIDDVKYNFSSWLEEASGSSVQFELSLTLQSGSGYRLRLKEGANE